MPQTLIDPFGRRIEYVLLSVTDRRNLRCSYCLPKGFTGFDEPDDWLSFAEIERVIGAFARLGVSNETVFASGRRARRRPAASVPGRFRERVPESRGCARRTHPAWWSG